MTDNTKERVLKLLDQFRESIINDKYDFYKYFIADLFDELAKLKAEQYENTKKDLK